MKFGGFPIAGPPPCYLVSTDASGLSCFPANSLDLSRSTLPSSSNGPKKDYSGYAQSPAAGDCYSGGPQRNSSYGSGNSQPYHPYRR
ncbi:hypothetical protein HUJ05_011530 [Dendroctonus ponderosae]|nr:hypothetical protein HUJ05_011530 [Dendroctonus ponderosae]